MQVCLFDIDGTLLSTGGAGRAAIMAAMAEFGVSESIDSVPIAGRTDRAIARELFERFAIPDSPENWQRFLAAYLRQLDDHLSRRPGHVLPGISTLLDQLCGRHDLAVGLLTGNVRDGASMKLDFYGLSSHFGFGGYGDHHVCRHDVAREALGAACDHLQCTVGGDDVWVLGDTPFDIRCARAIGARAIAVATGSFSLDELAGERPDVLLADFSDTPAVLAHWG